MQFLEEPAMILIAKRLEDAAELEEPFMMAGVADAPTDEDRTKQGFSEQSNRAVTGQLWRVWIVIHFGDFSRAVKVDLLTDKRRQGKDFVEVTHASQEVLVAEKFVQAVRAEAAGAPEEELGRSCSRRAKSGTTSSDHESRPLDRHRTEIAGIKI